MMRIRTAAIIETIADAILFAMAVIVMVVVVLALGALGSGVLWAASRVRG